MWIRPFLTLSALAWLPYGLLCFFRPDLLDGIAGVASGSVTGTIELRAMYGGLQVGLGLLAGVACFRPSLERPALVALAFLAGGLFVARAVGALHAGSLSGYTGGALVFELFLAAAATRLLPGLPGSGSRTTG